jgi:RNA polymerase sigma factor (sigma-70 family)
MANDWREELLFKYEPMVWHIAKRIRRRVGVLFVDAEDLASEVRLGFVDSLRTFNPSWEIPFGLYARTAGYRYGFDFVRREVARGIRVLRTDRRRKVKVPVVHSLDHPIGEDESTLADSIPDRLANDVPEDQDLWWVEAFANMSEQQKIVLSLYYRDGMNQSEIGRHLGIHQSRVWKVIREGLTRLRTPAKDRPPLRPAKKLSDEQKIQAVRWRGEGVPVSEIARRLGIDTGGASRISRGIKR